MKKFKDRVAVVTGAASGIGRATSIQLAEMGCRVAITDVNRAGLEETAKIIQDAGGNVSSHVLDVSDREKMAHFPEEVMKIHGKINLLINNAGVAITDTVLEGSFEDFEWLMGVNFWGVVYGCTFFLPYLLKEDEAHIVNFSSIFGLAGIPTQTKYCASKFAVRGFTEALQGELSKSRVAVSCVYPGGVSTNIARNARFKKSYACTNRDEMIEVFDNQLTMSPDQAARILIKRIGKNRKRILIGSDAWLLQLATRLFPIRYHRFLKPLFGAFYPA